MTNLKHIILTLVLFLFVGWSLAGDGPQSPTAPESAVHYAKSYLFTGKLDKMQTFGNGNSVQALMNMIRPNPTLAIGWRGRSGTTEHNSTALGAATVESLHAYYNRDMDTQHFFAQYNNTIYEATNYPPTAGTTFGSAIYSIPGSPGIAFSDQINGDWVAAASGVSPFAWSGGYAYPDGFLIQRDASGTTYVYNDGYEFVRDNDDSTYIVCVQDSGTTQVMYVGFRRRLDGVEFTFTPGGTTNALTAGVTVHARRSGAWVGVSGLTDGTSEGDSGVTTFYENGIVSWTHSDNDQPYVLPGTQIHLFWYKIYTTADITDGIEIARIRVVDDCEAMTNLWSGLYDSVGGCLKSTTTGYLDYSTQVTQSTDTLYADVGELPTTQYFYVGCTKKAFGIHLKVEDENTNTDTAATMTVCYWDATSEAWTSVGTIDDGTSQGTYSLSQSGTVQWDGSSFTEQTRTLGGILTPMYWYRFSWNATLPASVYIYNIGFCEKPDDFPKYAGVLEYNGRALWWPGDEFENAIDFSYGPIQGYETVQGLPHVLNGSFAGSTGAVYGPGEINAVARLYYYAVVSTKNPYRLYMLEGKVPGAWDDLMISDSVGVVAPHSLIVIEDEVNLFSKNMGVHAGFFLAPQGAYMVDGKTLIRISDNIAEYWDTNAAPYIEPSYAHLAYAWLDYLTKTVHLAVPINTTGTGTQTTCNYELVFNWTTLEWYDRHQLATPAACGLNLVGSNNQHLTYIGDYNGKVHRTNYGDDDGGTIINHYVRTSDFLLIPGEDSLNKQCRLRSVRVKAKSDSEGYIDVTVYPDGATTGTSYGASSAISLVNAGYAWVSDKVAGKADGELFSIQLESGTTDVGARMEIVGYTVEGYAIRRTPEK